MTAPAIALEDLGGGRGRYVAQVEGLACELTFVRIRPGIVRADHTGVPDALGGRGLGKALVERLVSDCRALGVKIEPACSFVEALFRRRPDWTDLRA